MSLRGRFLVFDEFCGVLRCSGSEFGRGFTALRLLSIWIVSCFRSFSRRMSERTVWRSDGATH